MSGAEIYNLTGPTAPDLPGLLDQLLDETMSSIRRSYIRNPGGAMMPALLQCVVEVTPPRVHMLSFLDIRTRLTVMRQAIAEHKALGLVLAWDAFIMLNERRLDAILGIAVSATHARGIAAPYQRTPFGIDFLPGPPVPETLLTEYRALFTEGG